MYTIDDYTKYYLNIKTSYNNFISLHNHIFINHKKYNITYNNIIVHKYILNNNINSNSNSNINSNNNINSNIHLYNDIIVYNNYIALFNHNQFNYIHIYTITNSVIKLYKSIDVSCMFYHCYANKKVRRTCIRIYMSIMHMHRSDCYMEGILSYINIEDIKNIKEYKEGMVVEYNSNINNINSNNINNINSNINSYTIIYDKYLNIINTSNTTVNDNSSDIKLNSIPNNLIQDTFMIKIYKDNISIIKDDSTYINKKKIKIRKYEVYENKIYNLYKDTLQIIEII